MRRGHGRAAHARASARGQVRRGSIAKAARSMSVEQVEAAHLELEVCLPAARGCAPSCSDLCMPVNAGAKAWTSASTESGHQYRGNITFLLPETTQARNDSAAGRSRHDDLRELHDVMESSSRRAAFEPRPHQGASWPSTAGFTSSSRLWLLRRRAARGEFGPHSRRPGENLLHATPPAAVPIPVCLEISPT